jgi:nicotinamide riboside transporter PnuC
MNPAPAGVTIGFEMIFGSGVTCLFFSSELMLWFAWQTRANNESDEVSHVS